MTKSKLKHATVSITAIAFVLLVGVIPPISSAIAETINLNGSIPLGAGSISGVLHGDLTKNILTLDRKPLSSKMSVDTAATGPLPPSIFPGSFTYTQSYSVNLPSGNSDTVSYNVEFIITPHINARLIVPMWNFGIGGSANLDSGIARFVAIPQLPATIGTINATSSPIFKGKIITNLDPLTAALAQSALDTTLVELNSSGAKLNLSLTGNWEKLSISSATMRLVQPKPNIKIVLGLTSAFILGKFDYSVDLRFTSTTNNGFIGNVFKEEIESLIEDEIMNRLLSYVGGEFDREVNGKLGMYKQDCSGQKLGPTRISISCDLKAQIGLMPKQL